MKAGLTSSLVVCVAAAGVAVGALALEPGGGAPPRPTADAGPAPGPHGGAPAPQAPTGPPYGTGAAAAPGAATGGPTLEIREFEFPALTVEAGATVSVTNDDGFPHTATADDGSFDSGVVDGGGRGRLTAPTAPGTYPIHCEFHPRMSGTLTVS